MQLNFWTCTKVLGPVKGQGISMNHLLLSRIQTHSCFITISGISNNDVISSLVTQPMLQPPPNQTELRLMVSKSIFNVDSKNVSKKLLDRYS